MDIPYISRRSPVYATHAMPLASEIGYSILKKGGNAIDAAIGVAAALGLTEPFSTGIGGDCFMLYYEKESGKVYAMNGSGRTPKSLSLDIVKRDCGDTLPLRHVHCVTVPGTVADAVERFGTMSMKEILSPTIELCENGYPVNVITSHYWKECEELLRKQKYGKDLLIDNNSPKEGELFINQHLGQVLRKIVNEGKDGFYKGEIAESIIEILKEEGSVMTLEDLANHQTEFPTPISCDFLDNIIYECPPNGQGITVLIALNILKHTKIFEVEPFSCNYYHLIIESLKLAFNETQYYVCDPEKYKIPIDILLSDKHAEEYSNIKDLPNPYPLKGNNTVSFQTYDIYGNSCSFVNSVYCPFGSGIIPKECGFTLHNRGNVFSLNSNHPNCINGNKRPYHTIIPCMITSKENDFKCSLSVMGAFMQPQGQVQVILNLLINHLNPQISLDYPRFCINVNEDGEIEFEDGFNDEIIKQLRLLGHNIKYPVVGYERGVFGRGQVILLNNNRVLCGGSDGRGDGMCIGF